MLSLSSRHLFSSGQHHFAIPSFPGSVGLFSGFRRGKVYTACSTVLGKHPRKRVKTVQFWRTPEIAAIWVEADGAHEQILFIATLLTFLLREPWY